MQRIKDGLMAAHDAILEARVASTHQANKHRRDALFKVDDLVYLSTKNIAIPKGRSRKLTPRYIGPYKIIREIVKGTTYEIDLPNDLKARGIHPAFHVSLLRKHVPLDDRQFPGRTFAQVSLLGEEKGKWQVEKVETHQGRGPEAEFLIKWKSGDRTWEPYGNIKHLSALDEYCEVQGVAKPEELPYGEGRIADAGVGAGQELATANGNTQRRVLIANRVKIEGVRGIYEQGGIIVELLTSLTLYPTYIMNAANAAITQVFTSAEIAACAAYLERFLANTEGGVKRLEMWKLWLKLTLQSTGAGQQAQTITQANTVTITTDAFSDLVSTQRGRPGPRPFNNRLFVPYNHYRGPHRPHYPNNRDHHAPGRPHQQGEGRRRNRRDRNHAENAAGSGTQTPMPGLIGGEQDITMLNASGIAAGTAQGDPAAPYEWTQVMSNLVGAIADGTGAYTHSEEWNESSAAPSPAPTTTTVRTNKRMDLGGPMEGIPEEGEKEGPKEGLEGPKEGEGSKGKGKETIKLNNLTDNSNVNKASEGLGSSVAQEGEC
ncbi:hypothetical protein FRC09_017513 [Ceratobasidium sp. 395]|nr:hypothetical protein FRC09_017513 [Ceratobasidium sp. 395]